MSILDWPRRAWNWLGDLGSETGEMNTVLSTVIPAKVSERYDFFDAWVDSNDIYLKLFSVGKGPGKSVRPLGNPAHEVVEFHASHLWPETLEELPLESDKENVKEAADKILEWSNWGETKQIIARWFPTHGHFFLKAERVEESERHYVRLMEPRHVTDYKKDPRGFIVMMRLDIPIEKDGVKKTHTELWEKASGEKKVEADRGRFRMWEHDHGVGAKIELLGTPDEDKPLTASGIDFVPFVHAPFQANGRGRGESAFAHALEPIGELDKIVSWAHNNTFKKDAVALKRNEAGAAAVTLEELSRTDESKGTEVEVGGEDKRIMFLLPGTASAEILTAPIDAAAVELIANQWDVIFRKCPELLYYTMQNKGDPSGIALSLKLAPAQDRGLEARYNGEGAIVQCIKMCLSLNQAAGVEGFTDIGSFDGGDFDGLKFQDRQLLPQTDEEKAMVEKAQLEVLELRARVLGEPLSVLRREFGAEDTQPVGPDDVVIEPTGNDDVVVRIAERLGTSNGQP